MGARDDPVIYPEWMGNEGGSCVELFGGLSKERLGMTS